MSRPSSLQSSHLPGTGLWGLQVSGSPQQVFKLDGGWGCQLGSLGEFRGSGCYRVRGTGPPAKSREGLGGSQGHLLGFAHAGGLVPQGTGVRLLHSLFLLHPGPGVPLCPPLPAICPSPGRCQHWNVPSAASPPSPGQPCMVQDTCPPDVPLPHCLLPLVSSLIASFASHPHPWHSFGSMPPIALQHGAG